MEYPLRSLTPLFNELRIGALGKVKVFVFAVDVRDVIVVVVLVGNGRFTITFDPPRNADPKLTDPGNFLFFPGSPNMEKKADIPFVLVPTSSKKRTEPIEGANGMETAVDTRDPVVVTVWVEDRLTTIIDSPIKVCPGVKPLPFPNFLKVFNL